jgi:FKBP-type peptidyl-prolyl cis-trans isomerase FkpA
MKGLKTVALSLALVVQAACGGGDEAVEEHPAAEPPPPAATESPSAAVGGSAEAFEIEPGLSARILKEGSGETAEAGQTAVVHYTGWLYDPAAPDDRGSKFDSSLDRGEPFSFPIGAGRVIAGWDRGVAGMKTGEVRELTIAPALAYGERGAGGAIPPGATLVFEVELLELEGGAAQ